MAYLRNLVGSENAGEAYLLAVEKYGDNPTFPQLQKVAWQARKPPKTRYREMGLKNPDSLYMRDDGSYWLAPISPLSYMS